MPDAIQDVSTNPISDTGKALPSHSTTRFSRSPHPYHRNSSTLPRSPYLDSIASQYNTQDASAVHKRNGTISPGYFDTDGCSRLKTFTSPSDSGTEADDEGTGLLKGLPAPPVRPRKGLKDLRNYGNEKTPSPLLTPSYLDDYRRRPERGYQFNRRGESRSQLGSDEDSRQIRAELFRRQRAEVIRRTSETTCLGLVAYAAVQGAEIDPANIKALWRLMYIVLGIYMSYPLHLVLRQYQIPTGFHGPLIRLRVPSAFDPAPLLYPIVLPVLAALSVMPDEPYLLVPNIVLSISSIPVKAIPSFGINPSTLHWMLSTIPLAIFPDTRIIPAQYLPSASSPGSISLQALDSELLVLIYPLHRTLLSSLGFLTTTSLLATELQLLSAALINLLLFSTTPQAVILQAILWIGGISMFVLCRQVLSWAVAIARIPSWRFRRVSQLPGKYNPILRAIDDCFRGRFSHWWRVKNGQDDSESDQEHDLIARSIEVRTREGLKLKTRANCNNDQLCSAIDDSEPMPAHGTESRHKTLDFNRSFSPTESQFKHPRRHTLPTYIGVLPEKPIQITRMIHKRLQSQFVRPKSFLSLTAAQATILKWIYASYVYIVAIVSIAIPIRIYISHWSLHGHEPVGWALGYLLGDLNSFRYWTVSWNLERWICLPPREMPPNVFLGRAERARILVLGAANVRLLICAYCIAVIGVGLAVVLRLSAVVEVDTRRKVFHGMMVAMFLPVTYIDPAFAALALALILAVFLLLDLFRASQLPPLSKPLTYFLAPYVDGRDHRGPVIVSHIFLLVGCAIPLWLSLAALERDGIAPWNGWEVPFRDLSMVSGVVCVGMGDAAASLIGRRYGRRRWLWSGGKSCEGSLAFALAVVLGLSLARAWLQTGGWAGDSTDSWMTTLGKAAVAAVGASFTEAVLTGGNDNVIVPIVLWLLVRGLKI